MRKTLPTLFFAAGALASTACFGLGTSASLPDSQAESSISVKFGIIKGSGKNAVVATETKNIPYKLCSSGDSYGYTLEHAKGKRFSTFAKVYPPGPLKSIDSSLSGNAAEASAKGITTQTEAYIGKGTERFCFTEGDPKGTWKLVVFINGVRNRTIEFTTR